MSFFHLINNWLNSNIVKNCPWQTFAEYEARYKVWPSTLLYGENDYHPAGYDAVWSAALALNSSIEPLSKQV